MRYFRRAWWKILGSLLCTGLLFLSALYLFQDKLLFPARTYAPAALASLLADYPEAREMIVEAPGGIVLHGWHLPAAHPGKQPLVIYYGGNGNLAGEVLPFARHFGGRALLVMDYRGYGFSGGKPEEYALYMDALHIFDCMVERDDVDADRIVLMGFSLGTAVATFISSHRPVQGVILAAPFDSVAAMVQEKFSFLPAAAGSLVRNRLDAFTRAPATRAPLLALMGEEDRVIPNRRSLALVSLWGGGSTVEIIPGRGHNDMHLHPHFWESIDRFLNSLEISRH